MFVILKVCKLPAKASRCLWSQRAQAKCSQLAYQRLGIDADRNDAFKLANKPFRYNLSVGLADNTSEITKFDNPSKILSDYYVGQKLGDIWGYVVDGLFRTDEEAANYNVDQTAVNFVINTAQVNPGLHAGDMKFVDLDGDHTISSGSNTADDPGDRKIIGNSLPRYTYSIQGGFDWYGFDFSIYLQGVGHQDWYPGTNSVFFWGPYARPYSSFIPRDFLSGMEPGKS